MKLIVSLILLSITLLAQAQDKPQLSDSIDVDQISVQEYMRYKKYMYIDYIPMAKIPEGLKTNFYSDLSPTNFTHDIAQQMDTINQIHRLYLTTNQAGQGYLKVNQGALTEVDLDDVSQIIYVVNNDTVKTYKQMSDLVALKRNQLQSADYKKTDSNQLIIKVNTQ